MWPTKRRSAWSVNSLCNVWQMYCDTVSRYYRIHATVCRKYFITISHCTQRATWVHRIAPHNGLWQSKKKINAGQSSSAMHLHRHGNVRRNCDFRSPRAFWNFNDELSVHRPSRGLLLVGILITDVLRRIAKAAQFIESLTKLPFGLQRAVDELLAGTRNSLSTCPLRFCKAPLRYRRMSVREQITETDRQLSVSWCLLADTLRTRCCCSSWRTLARALWPQQALLNGCARFDNCFDSMLVSIVAVDHMEGLFTLARNYVGGRCR